jgi:signal transduction histidine kinase
MSGQHRRPKGVPEHDTSRVPETARRVQAAAAAERRIADRFARLHAATAALSAALTRAEVATAVATRGAALPGACACAIALRRRDGALEVAAARGAVGPLTGGGREVRPTEHVPLAAAERLETAVFSVGDGWRAEDLSTAGATLAAGARPLPATAALPLVAGGERLGVVGVVFDGPVRFDEEERAFLQAFAYQCALALERARLYEAEREARVAAQHAMELHEQLVGIVGHDLRTPLAAIRMSAAVLFQRGDLGSEQARTVARIGASAARMSRIIRDLLDFTRVRKDGALPVEPRPTDLVDLARRAVAELAAVHPDRELRLDAPGSAPVEVDPDRLFQAVTNLVGNAIQHGRGGGRVLVSVVPGAGVVGLLVHNDGPPIPAELQGEIFEPFRRGRAGGEGGSLGLGLFIVREVVRAHGGTVEVHSTAADGTTFTLRLPSARAGATASGRPPPALESHPREG